ncbi:Kinesin-like protein kifc1 [Chamberlinius hualienensis]
MSAKSSSAGFGSKLPTPMQKRTDNIGQKPDIKRRRLDISDDHAPNSKLDLKRSDCAAKINLKRSQSVNSLVESTRLFRNDNKENFKKPTTADIGKAASSRLYRVPSAVSLNEKSANKGSVSAPVTKGGKRPAWDLKGRVEDQELALRQYTKHNSDLESKVASMADVLLKLQQDNTKEKQVAISKSNESAQLSSQLSTLQSDLFDKEKAVQKLENKTLQLNGTISGLEMQLKLKDEQNSSQKLTIMRLEHEHDVMKEELHVAKTRISDGLSKIESLNQVIADQSAKIESLECQLKKQEGEIWEAEAVRRKLHNEVQELKGNIRVYCRVRPTKGNDSSSKMAISFPEETNNQLVINVPSANNKSKKAEFCYDRVFNHSATQPEIFNEISQLVQSSLDGYNVCIFAYGQTGSGKTYTMEGPPSYKPNETGVIGRAVCQIFKSIYYLESKGWHYDMKATFLEVYNEVIRDLLANGKNNLSHEIRMTDTKSEVYVTNLNVVDIKCEDQIEQLLKTAHKNRAVAATQCNDHSSRSHSVFQLQITGNNTLTGESLIGTLNLVDLAGSERLKESGSEGDRLKETKNINKSLSNLGNVIMSLAQKAEHIPYRNSKLTHLLMNCLGGNSKTLMFVNVSPEEEAVTETLSSLRFATKVNNCQIGTASKKVK